MSETPSEMILATGYYPAVTPDDDNDLAKYADRYPKGISIGGTGDLKVTDLEDNVVTFSDGELATGIIHPIRVKRIWSTDTTATLIRVYY